MAAPYFKRRESRVGNETAKEEEQQTMCWMEGTIDKGEYIYMNETKRIAGKSRYFIYSPSILFPSPFRKHSMEKIDLLPLVESSK